MSYFMNEMMGLNWAMKIFCRVQRVCIVFTLVIIVHVNRKMLGISLITTYKSMRHQNEFQKKKRLMEKFFFFAYKLYELQIRNILVYSNVETYTFLKTV